MSGQVEKMTTNLPESSKFSGELVVPSQKVGAGLPLPQDIEKIRVVQVWHYQRGISGYC
jgi:hypothetical protein